ncbi:leucine-rich repeat-containing protein 74A-like [Aedes albopictus]|uniref:Uncharacterized protein n=1 Tax=Aedes albopictus TaxID=7160 RepID=A0ABM1ZRJ1_AEDAL
MESENVENGEPALQEEEQQNQEVAAVDSEQLEKAILEEYTPLDISVCPFRGVSSKSTIVDESEDFPEPVDALVRLAAEEVLFLSKRSFVEIYVGECRKYGVTPLRYVCEILDDVEVNPEQPVDVDLNRIGCSNLQVQIILDCLVIACPDRINTLNISHNLLMNSALAVCLANLLQLAQRIVYLDLSHNFLGSAEAAEVLAEALSNSAVRKLNLSHCHLNDRSGMELFKALMLSFSIEEVDVSWNRLEHLTGVAAGAFLGVNSTIRELNLEGNLLYLEKECIVPFLKELAKNESLQRLNLSWNALRGALFSSALYKAITASRLKVLNLEMNCLRSEEAVALLKTFRKCEILEEIYVGGNFFSEDETKELVKAFGRNPTMKVLSLGDYQFVNKVAGRLSKRFMKRDPEKTIIYQGVLLSNPPRPVDVPEMLLERCRFLGFKPKRKKRKRDLGLFMLQLQKLESPVLERDDFVAMVKKFRIKLDKSLLGSLMDAFAERKLVDSGAMALKYLGKYPTEWPPEKPKKAKRKKKKGVNGESKGNKKAKK